MKKLDDLLKSRIINYSKLNDFGFINNNNEYYYEKEVLDEFKVIIEIINDKVTAKLIEIDMNEEYLPAYNSTGVGEYITNVRNEFESVINSFINKCTTRNAYKSKQAIELINYIKDKYDDDLEFLWEKFDTNAIVRNKNNEKWYAVFLKIDSSKLGKKTSGEIEIIDLRYQKENIDKIIDNKKVFSGYHMNKNSWITIKLDGSIDTKEICSLIDNSYNLVNKKSEWVIPANASYFDVIGYFDVNDIISWRYIKNILPGDIVYIYIGVPYSAIMYKCEAIGSGHRGKVEQILLKKLRKYNRFDITLDKMKKLGVRAVRGPRTITESLSKELNRE